MSNWWDDYPEASSNAASPAPEAARAAKDAGPSLLDRVKQVGRQLGLTLRAGVNGVAALPAMAADAVTAPINAALDLYNDRRAPTASELVTGKQRGFRFPRQADALNAAMTAAGVPEPQTATERVAGDMASALAGTGATVGAGKLLAGSGNAIAQAVGDALSAGPGAQAVSAAGGAGAAGVAREEGASPAVQAAAGLAGAAAPVVLPAAAGAAARAALRGGEEGRQATERVIQAFDAAGAQPTVGQATGNRLAQATESMLAKAPGGAGVMNEFAGYQARKLATAVQNLSDELAPDASAINAGEAIEKGIQAFKTGVKAVQRRLYDSLDKHLPADTPIPVTSTHDALAELNAEIPNAPSLSQFFVNSRIKGIDGALQADLDAASGRLAASVDGAGAGGIGTLPYESVKRLRTLVGEELTNNTLTPDVPRAQWARLYGALSDDLGAAAQQAGPDAHAAWQWANAFTRTQMERLEQLQSVINRDAPERIFAATVRGTAEGDTIARRVISALPISARREVAAAVLQRMGRATPGQQNAMGDAFSSETFLSNLAKMSPAARTTIFGRTKVDGVIEQLEKLAQVAAVRRESGKAMANPSGTAQAAAQLGLASGLAGGVVGAALGHPGPLMAALAVPAAAHGTAKALTSQKLLDLARTQATLPEGLEAAAVNAAAHVVPHDGPGPAPAPATHSQWWEQLPLHDAEPVRALAPVDVASEVLKAPTLDAAIEATKALPTVSVPPLPAPSRLALEVQRMKASAEARRLERMRAEAAASQAVQS